MKSKIFRKFKKILNTRQKVSFERTKLQKLQDRVEFYKDNGYWEQV